MFVTLSSPPSFLLSQFLGQIWQELSSFSSCTIKLQWVPRHSLLQKNDTVDELARWIALVLPSGIPCSLFFSTSCIHTSLFSYWGCIFLDWRRLAAYSLTHRFPRFPLRNFFASTKKLPLQACSVLARLCFNKHSIPLNFFSLVWAEFRILHAAPAAIQPRTPLISLCIVQLVTFCAACSLATFRLSTTSSAGPANFPGF